MKKIYLFTSTFPYGVDEFFLEEEIKYLSNRFEEVRVFPNDVGGAIRKVPKNVIVDDTWSKIRKGSNVSCLDVKLLVRLISNLKYSIDYNRLMIKYICAEKLIDKLFENISGFDMYKTVFYTYWFSATTVGLTTWKQKNMPIVIVSRAHGIDLYENRSNIDFFPFRKNTISLLNRVFPISLDGCMHLKNKYGPFLSKIKLSRLGTVDSDILNPYINDKTLRIVSCSNVISVKRLDLLIDALSLFESDVDIEWTHIGDGVLFDNISKYANQKLEGVIKFKFLGFIPNVEVRQYYMRQSIDVFINVSLSEGLPMSIMEAQSFSIPVIATNVGGVKEIVNNTNGLLIKSDISPKELYLLLSTIDYNDPQWIEKRLISRKSWEEKYQSSENYTRFSNLFIDIIES